MHMVNKLLLFCSPPVNRCLLSPWSWCSLSPSQGSNWLTFLFFRFFCCCCCFCFCFLGLHPWHMEVPRLGVKWGLQLLAYTTVTPDPRHVCDLHHSSWQCRILNPLSEARDRTHILMDTSQIRFCCTTTGTPNWLSFLWNEIYWPFTI